MIAVEISKIENSARNREARSIWIFRAHSDESSFISPLHFQRSWAQMKFSSD